MYDKIKTPIEKTEQSSLHFLECSITCQLIKQNHIVKKESPQKNKNKINSKQSKIHSRELPPNSQLILHKNSFEIVSGAIRELILNNTNQY